MTDSVVSAQQDRRVGAQAQVVRIAVASRIVAATDPGADTESNRAAQARLGNLAGGERQLDVPAQVEPGVVLHPFAQPRPGPATRQEVGIAAQRQRTERDAKLVLAIATLAAARRRHAELRRDRIAALRAAAREA